jgi:hypothetical protein
MRMPASITSPSGVSAMRLVRLPSGPGIDQAALPAPGASTSKVASSLSSCSPSVAITSTWQRAVVDGALHRELAHEHILAGGRRARPRRGRRASRAPTYGVLGVDGDWHRARRRGPSAGSSIATTSGRRASLPPVSLAAPVSPVLGCTRCSPRRCPHQSVLSAAARALGRCPPWRRRSRSGSAAVRGRAPRRSSRWTSARCSRRRSPRARASPRRTPSRTRWARAERWTGS